MKQIWDREINQGGRSQFGELMICSFLLNINEEEDVYVAISKS